MIVITKAGKTRAWRDQAKRLGLCQVCGQPAAPHLRRTSLSNASGLSDFCVGCRTKRSARRKQEYRKTNKSKLGRAYSIARTVGPCSCNAKTWKRATTNGRRRVECSVCHRTWNPDALLVGVAVDFEKKNLDLEVEDYLRYLSIRK